MNLADFLVTLIKGMTRPIITILTTVLVLTMAYEGRYELIPDMVLNAWYAILVVHFGAEAFGGIKSKLKISKENGNNAAPLVPTK